MAPKPQIAAFLPAALLIAFGMGGLGVVKLAPNQVAGVPLGIVVLGHRSADAARVIAAADGRLVSSGGWLGATIAVSSDPDFAARLYSAGASFVFRADRPYGCAAVAKTAKGTS